MSKLTNKQRIFIKEYMVDLNATAAAKRAGYSEKTAYRTGNDNLQKPQIQLALQRAMKKREERTEITADMVLKELAKVAFADLGDYLTWQDGGSVAVIASDKLTPDKRAALAEISETVTESGGTVKIKLHDKLRALRMIGEHLEMFTDRLNISLGENHAEAVEKINERMAGRESGD